MAFIEQNGDIKRASNSVDSHRNDSRIVLHERRAILRDGSTSPLNSPQSKYVQTDDAVIANADNYVDVLNNLIDELKAVLKIANQVYYKTNNQVITESLVMTKQTQTSAQLKATNDAFTQYETKSQLLDAFCQINAIVRHKGTQTVYFDEQKVTKVKAIDIWTQTDPLTDEDKSYDLSVGEIPYISDDSTFC